VLKPALWIACLTPLSLLVFHAFRGELSANPVEDVTNTTGIWTLRLIVATLLITPLRWATGVNQVIQYRRAVGLFAFFYGSLHFMTYFILDHQLQFGGLWEDVKKRPYITAGFTAFVLMIPLAITSTTGWIRRMGGKKWNLLHQLIYVTALAAVLHYFWKVKLDATNPIYYGLVVGALLIVRLIHSARRRQAASSRQTANPSTRRRDTVAPARSGQAASGSTASTSTLNGGV
jgi:methionine sulfoxide reductase heme-binding subunit